MFFEAMDLYRTLDLKSKSNGQFPFCLEIVQWLGLI